MTQDQWHYYLAKFRKQLTVFLHWTPVNQRATTCLPAVLPEFSEIVRSGHSIIALYYQDGSQTDYINYQTKTTYTGIPHYNTDICESV